MCIFASIASLVVAILVLRRPSTFATPQLFAEDGVVFFRDSLLCGPSAFWYQYAGYIHGYPRLVASVGASLPVDIIPACYLLAALLVVLLVCWSLTSPRLNIPTCSRVLMGLPLCLPPLVDGIHTSLAYSQWYLALLVPLTIAKAPPRAAREAITDGASVLAAVATSPAAMLLVPLLFLVRVKTSMNRRYLLWLVPAVLMACVQGVTVLESGRFVHAAVSGREVLSLAGQGIGRALLGAHYPPGASIGVSSTTLSLLAAAILLLVVKAGRATAPPAVFALSAGLFWLSAVVTFAGAPNALIADRYHFLPVVLLLWSATTATAHVWLAVLVGLSVPILRLDEWSLPPRPDLSWKHRAACVASMAEPCIIPINPVGWHIDFQEPVGKRKLRCGPRD